MSRAILPEDSTESFAAHGRDERHIVHILGGDRIDGENTFLEEGGIFPDARNTPNGDRHPRERRPVEYLDDGNVNGGLDPLCCGGNLFFRRVFCCPVCFSWVEWKEASRVALECGCVTPDGLPANL
jgi:hypothetical protein